MQITYFPYLPLKDNQIIDLGNGLVIWHFYSLAEKYIPDRSLRTLITQLLGANVQGESQEKIKGIAVASVGKVDFRQLTYLEENQIQEAKLVIFVSKIAKTNTAILGSGADGWTLSTSENFEPVYQNFEIGNDHIAERAGYIINLGIGGYRINEKKFHKPSHVAISPFGMPIDRELFTQLLKLKIRAGKRLYRRILRATDLFFQAYYNTTNVSRNARILLIAAAFETLLNLADPARKHFKDLVEMYCDLPGETKYRHYYPTRTNAKRDKNRSIKVLWADAFFTLRNQIIHGDAVPEDMYFFQNSDRHLDISVLFFCHLVKSLINEKAGDPKPFADQIHWEKRKNKSTGFAFQDHSLTVAISRSLRKSTRRHKNP